LRRYTTALVAAARAGRLPTMKALIERGAQVRRCRLTL